MRYCFPYVGADLRKLSLQPGIQRTLRDHEYGLVYHACLLPSILRLLIPPYPQKAGSG